MGRRWSLGRYVRTRALPPGTERIAYHATYGARSKSIEREGLRPSVTRADVWFAANAAGALEHMAKRAVDDGCANAPIALVKARLTSRRKCPLYRPVRPGGVETFTMPCRVEPGRVEVVRLTPAMRHAYEAALDRAVVKIESKPGGRVRRRARCPPPTPALGRTR